MGSFTDKLKGRIKSVTGKATGNRSLETKGERDELKGKVKSGVEDVKHAFKEAERRDPKPGDY